MVTHGLRDKTAPRLGAWAMIPDPISLEILGRSGVDWVGLDLQHGTFNLGEALRAIQLLEAIGTPAYVRVSENELHLIAHVGDAGASGIVVAMVGGPDVAREAVAMATYQPAGRRSYGGQRYGLRVGSDPLAMPRLFPMIESQAGLATCEAIAAVPGIVGLHVGPVDLGLALGLGLDRDQPAWHAAVARIRDAAKAAGISTTMHAVEAADAATWRDAGFDEVVLVADVGLLSNAIRAEVARARESAS